MLLARWLRSARPEEVDDWWLRTFVARALEERRGEGGAIEAGGGLSIERLVWEEVVVVGGSARDESAQASRGWLL